MMGMKRDAVHGHQQQQESDVLHLFLSMRVKSVVPDDDDDASQREEEKKMDVPLSHDTDNEDTESVYHDAVDSAKAFLQIFTLVNLRALPHEFGLKSEWSMVRCLI